MILAVGTEISETDLWETKITIPGKVIRIDIDPASLVRPHAAALPILADAATALAALAAALSERGKRPGNPKARPFIRDHLAGEPEGEDRLRSRSPHRPRQDPPGAAARNRHCLGHDADRLCRQ